MKSFDEFIRVAEEAGFDSALDYLEQVIRREQNYASLFEVLKMRIRRKLGLSVLYSDAPDSLSPEQQRALEDGLLEACREVGTLLFKAGELQQGWMYLQPVGDKSLNERLVSDVEVNEDNLDTLVEIAVSQGASPIYGFKLLAEHFGTCNAITTFDSQAGMFDRTVQRGMAEVLLRHLHEELMGNLRYALGNQDPPLESSGSLAELMERYPDLTEGGAHHIDTTHLASIMRMARLVEDPELLELAWQLALYGRGLDEDFQYRGQPPFENTYEDHLHYFGPLTGRDVQAGVKHFYEKLETVDEQQYGPVAVESLVELLARLGRNEEALQLTVDRLLGQHSPLGIAPDPLALANSESSRQKLMDHYRRQDDLVSFAACWVKGRETVGPSDLGHV